MQQQDIKQPSVAVIIPVKGQRNYDSQVYASQLNSSYRGKIKYYFVLDSSSDPAFNPLSDILDSQKEVEAEILIAGYSSTCSQKIYNLIAGIRNIAADYKYILCLDNDIILHQSTFTSLVNTLEDNPSLCLATGYPFDMIPRGSSFAAHCTLAYHLPLLIGVAGGEKTKFCWGGCMLLHREAMQQDKYGIIQAWQEGGYSDDMIIGSKIVEHSLMAGAPASAIFPQWVHKDTTFPQYWNYLHKQLVVLDTYCNFVNRILNHALLLILCGSSFLYTLQFLCTFLASASLAYYYANPSSFTHMPQHQIVGNSLQ